MEHQYPMRSPAMKTTVLGIDLAKNVFQLHGVDDQGKVMVRKKLTRPKLLPFVAQLAPCRIGMEACQGAHYWAREMRKLGLAELLAHGLSKPRCVPPPAMRALRDLTRTRVSLVQTRTQAKNRVYKMLEDTNIQLASVGSDVFGKRARRMLEALGAGERDAAKLSAMALGNVRRQIPQLAVALAGQLIAHHARLIAGALELKALERLGYCVTLSQGDKVASPADRQLGMPSAAISSQAGRITTRGSVVS
jgi:transposase